MLLWKQGLLAGAPPRARPSDLTTKLPAPGPGCWPPTLHPCVSSPPSTPGARCATTEASSLPVTAPACAPFTPGEGEGAHGTAGQRMYHAVGHSLLCMGGLLRLRWGPAACCSGQWLAAASSQPSRCLTPEPPYAYATAPKHRQCLGCSGCSLEDDDGGGCNMLLLPRDLAQYLANSNETLKCPNCLAHKHQASLHRVTVAGGRQRGPGGPTFGCCRGLDDSLS